MDFERLHVMTMFQEFHQTPGGRKMSELIFKGWQQTVSIGLICLLFTASGCGRGAGTATASAAVTQSETVQGQDNRAVHVRPFRFDASELQKSFENTLGLQFSVEKFEDGQHAIGRRGGKSGTGPIITIYRVGQDVNRFELIFNPQDHPKLVEQFTSAVIAKLCDTEKSNGAREFQRKSLRVWISDATVLLSKAKHDTQEFGRHSTVDSSIVGVFPSSRIFARDRGQDPLLPVFKFTFLPGTSVTGPLPGDG